MSAYSPPRWADRLVERICPREYLEEFQGDLHEAYHWRLDESNHRRASWKFIIETFKVLKFYKPRLMNSLFITLFLNYLRTGARFLWKTRGFSSLNIIGLALGIATAWLAYIFVSGELSFDRYHSNADRTYRIAPKVSYKGETDLFGGGSYIMGKEFPEKLPSIEKATWIKNGFLLMRLNNESQYQRTIYANKDLFDILDFQFISGSHEFFDDRNQVIISKSIAEKLEDPDHLELIVGGEERLFDVLGVYRDVPINSSIRPEIVMHMDFWTTLVPERRLTSWFDINMNVLLMIGENENPADVEQQMTDVLLENEDFGEMEPAITLQPLTDIHLNPDLGNGNGIEAAADMSIVRIAGLVGILCLIISCINFSNFALGNNLVRSREVGIRKVIGAGSGSVLGQFLSEAFLATLIAGLIATVLVILALPLYTELIQNSNYTLQSLLAWDFVIGAGSILIVTTLISGLYPAVVLSRFKIVEATKNIIKVGSKNFAGRLFISAQFAIAIFLIVGTIIANKQFGHLINYELGYNDKNVVTVSVAAGDEETLGLFRNDLTSTGGVVMTAPVSGYNGTDYKDENIDFSVRHLRTDANFTNLLEIPIINGRNFDPDSEYDLTKGIIVNETFLKKANISDPIGKTIPFKYGEFENPTIVGVVADYYFRSSRFGLDPIVIYQSPQYVLQDLIVKTDGDVEAFIPVLEDLYKKHYDPLPFNYELMTDFNLRMLRSENRVKKVTNAGSVIAIILASLGLLSMIGTYVRQRMKEVSIRKINGAQPISLYRYFSKKFIPWISAGFVVGFIPALIFLQRWLENYPHHISIDWTVGIIALLIAAVIFILTVLIQLTRVVYENPIKYLRDE